jgi:uncharacterized protein DUF1990
MPRQSRRVRRARTAARWPLGIAYTAFRYTWRITPIHRSERDGVWPGDGPPPVDPAVDRDGFQRPEDGSGPLFRRRYLARIAGATMTAVELMHEIKRDPNRVAPGGLARFLKTAGPDGVLHAGDEFLVRMPGPWDGPIRVVETTPTSFRFATLDGHLEAGQIEWRASDDAHGGLVFEIESWARAGDRLSHVLHDRLRMAKEVQLYMWTSVLERVARRTGGELDGGIQVETVRVELRP